jgi:Protein of unknown function (DUF3224)
MRRSRAVPSSLFFAVLAVLTVMTALTPSSASAASRVTATGSFTQLSFTVTGSRTAGALTFLNFTETDALSGSLTGTSELVGECIVFPSLEAMCKATETFTGTFDGSAGTLTFFDVVRLDTATGAVSGQFMIIDGSGGLAHVRGTGAFSGSGGTGTYSGTFTVG